MADTKPWDFPNKPAPAGTDRVPFVQGAAAGDERNITWTQLTAQVRAMLSATGGASYDSGSGIVSVGADLTAIEALSTTGIAKRTGANTWSLGTVEVSEIGATGTPGATNFLRGDGSWQVPPAATVAGPALLGKTDSGTGAAVAVPLNATTLEFSGGELRVKTVDITALSAAAAVADTDLVPVSQGSATALKQTFTAIWTWISAKFLGWQPAAVAISGSTTLSAAAHNNRVLKVTAASTLTVAAGTVGAGFSCTIVQAGAGVVTFSGTTNRQSHTKTAGNGAVAGLYSDGTTVWLAGDTAA